MSERGPAPQCFVCLVPASQAVLYRRGDIWLCAVDEAEEGSGTHEAAELMDAARRVKE